ncbi:MAG: hypothetical protein F4142_06770 [Nitrospira sp. SB0675_bin_23]|nr:hypothetical protein [Paracoccaceae bacterium]MYH02266.1 hypothetical protein [Nitrospira sp. SB0675_bin_23]
MDVQHQNENPSIEYLLGQITALQLSIARILVELQRKDVLNETDINQFFSMGTVIQPGKALAFHAGKQSPDCHNAMRKSLDEIRALLKPGVD